MQAAYPLHHVDKLNPEDAWSLLKRQVASSEMEELEIDDTLKDIGMKIIDKCDGLPLAVKVMGGLSRRRGRRRADWEQVLQDFIREGFLHGDTDDLEKLGQDCYKELIYRNLIEPDAGYADERVSSMHDVVRSFAQNLARDEALVVSFRDEISKGALKSQKFLRLSVETNHDEFGWKIIQGQKSLRTLIVIGELKINPGDSLINFSNLRTLHIQDTNCTASLVESLHQLKHLSLQEIGPLTQLQELSLKNLENVPATSLATKARLGEKSHLSYLRLECSSRLGEDGLVEDENGVSEEEQRRTEEVLDELTPPLCLENIDIFGYFGQRLPRWMTSRAASAYERLTIVTVEDLACCTQLPDSLCQLPCLNVFQVARAPELMVHNCKLRCLPPGLSSQAMALTSMYLHDIQQLKSVGSFASLVKLELSNNPDLERITFVPRLQKLVIAHCPTMMSLEGVPALQRLHLKDYDMEQLPRYLQQDVSPRHLQLDCSLELLTSIALGKSSPEWSKLSHVQHVKAYADQGDIERKWHVFYTRDPYSFETNIDNSSSSS
uniref:R13L1/DRL21-like LRR repeat region domain-containing protein n=1 Tax=Oryza glumipatula TaxID=40148 RepID=A0A0E0BMF0_9ORYZ